MYCEEWKVIFQLIYFSHWGERKKEGRGGVGGEMVKKKQLFSPITVCTVSEIQQPIIQ